MHTEYRSEHVITLKHYLVLCAIAFVAGIFYAVQYSIKHALFLSVALFLIMDIISIIAYVLKSRKTAILKVKKYIILPLLIFAFFLAGVGRIYLAEHVSEKSLRNYVNDSVWLYGTVSTVPEPTSTGYSYSFEMNVRGISKNDVLYPIKDRIIVYISNYVGKQLSLSDDISCWTSISYPKTDESEDIFDYHTYLKGKNIFVIGNTKNANIINNLDDIFPADIIDTFILKINELGSMIRSKISHALDNLFSYDPEANAIIKGILIGDKSGFSDTLYVQFSNAGISHIVAVSGMHLSIFFAALSLIFSSVRLHRKATLILSIPCLMIFVSTAGFSPSICRAALMLLLMIIATLISERYNSITSLFFALGIIISVTPYALFSPGLVLSFGATLGILVYSKYFKAFLNQVAPFRTFLNPIANSITLSVASFIGTAYFTVLFFQRLSWIQVLTNLWVIPLVSVIFCGGYLACILYYILPQSLISAFCYPVAGALKIIAETSNFFGTNYFSIYTPPESLSVFLPLTYFSIAVVLYLLCKNASDTLHDNLMR